MIHYDLFSTFSSACGFVERLNEPFLLMLDGDEWTVMYGDTMLGLSEELHKNMEDYNETLWDATGGWND